MQRPQSSGGISAGMEFLKVNIFKEKEGGERERKKYYKKKQQYIFFPFLFFLKNLVWDSLKAKPQRTAGGGLWCQ